MSSDKAPSSEVNDHPYSSPLFMLTEAKHLEVITVYHSARTD